MEKTIYWTPNPKEYLSLKYSLSDGVVSVRLMDGSIRKVSLQDCDVRLQNQFKQIN